MDNVTERVARAARYLDVIKPGWADNVNLDHFTMSSGNLCVCGQNGLGWQSVSRTYEEVANVDYGRELFSNYDAEWREEIEARKTPEPELLVFSNMAYGGRVLVSSEATLMLNGDILRISDRDNDSVEINLNRLREAS